jgi:hypothetical protein
MLRHLTIFFSLEPWFYLGLVVQPQVKMEPHPQPFLLPVGHWRTLRSRVMRLPRLNWEGCITGAKAYPRIMPRQPGGFARPPTRVMRPPRRTLMSCIAEAKAWLVAWYRKGNQSRQSRRGGGIN